MKKLILIAVTGIVLTSCSKDVKGPAEQNEPTTVNALSGREGAEGTAGQKAVRGTATVVDTKEQGLGFILKFNEFEWEVPSNLDKAYAVQGMKVDVVYFFTDKKVNCECEEPKHYIEILDITPVSKDQPQ